MQEEGISYFFDQSAKFEDKKYEKLVLVDCNEAFPKCKTLDDKPVPVAAHGAVAGHVETLHSLVASRELGANRAVVYNYDWTRPWFPLGNTLKKKEGDGPDLELYEHAAFDSVSKYSYDEARYMDDERHVQQRARIRLEEAQVGQKLCDASGNVTGLAAGMLFEAVARDGSDLEKEYLVRSVHHVGHSDESLAESEQAQASLEDYRNWFDCIPADVPYRPPRTHSHPVVQGLVTATVVGSAKEGVETDGYGRVTVQFHWDRVGKRNEKSSCWVRVAQAWAGPLYGTMFIPRIGMEVVVQFVEGDPDRPLIIGTVYNGVNTPAHKLPDHQTQSWIRTESLPKGGYNEICFEDRKGGEELHIHAQKEMTEKVEHDHIVTVGNDEKLTVKKNQTEDIGVDQTLKVHGNRSKTIDKDETITVKGGRSTSVTMDDKLSIDGGHEVHVAKEVSERFGADHTRDVKDNQHFTVGKDKTEKIAGVFELTTDKKYTLIQGGTTLELHEGKVALKAGDVIKIFHDNGVIEIAKDGSIKITSGQKVEIDGGGTKLTLKSGKAVISSDDADIG